MKCAEGGQVGREVEALDRDVEYGRREDSIGAIGGLEIQQLPDVTTSIRKD